MKGRTNCGVANVTSKFLQSRAALKIITPPSSTVSVSNGTISETLDSSWKVKDTDIYSVWNYFIDAVAFGTWTVNVTFDGITKQWSEVVDSTNEYEVNIICPGGYQQIAYIGSNNGASTGPYIDTGVIPTNNLCVEYYYYCSYMTSYADYKWAQMWGTGTVFNNYKHDNTSRMSFHYVDIDGEDHYFGELDTSLAFGNHYNKVDLFNGMFQQDELIKDIEVLEMNNSTLPFGLLKRRDDVQQNAYGGGIPYFYIKNFKMYESEVIVRYLIPCIKLAGEVRGMYDIVNDVFYTNSGSGTFTIGENLVY